MSRVQGSITREPPDDYWPELKKVHGPALVEALEKLSKQRVQAIRPEELDDPKAESLLDQLVVDGWFQLEERTRCVGCGREITEIADGRCSECDRDFAEIGQPEVEKVYTRNLFNRSVDWVIAIHGMNTRGAWQESFGWMIACTWGKAVPVLVYKYGWIITGVLLSFRRRSLLRALRLRLEESGREAHNLGYSQPPDLIAHSFGTWLIGHLLLEEVGKEPKDQKLRFGRAILTGCVLRPDFPWSEIKKAGLVEEVLNHYATADRIVPLAQVAIRDAGPSGRRGFDNCIAVNIRSEGFGHSDLLSTEKKTKSGESYLKNSYLNWWHPFLTWSAAEFDQLESRADPSTPWQPLPSPFSRLLPWLLLPLLVTVIPMLFIVLGKVFARFSDEILIGFVYLLLLLVTWAVGLGLIGISRCLKGP